MAIKGFNPAQYNFIPNPTPEMDFYQLIRTKIKFHPFIRKERYPLNSSLTRWHEGQTYVSFLSIFSYTDQKMFIFVRVYVQCFFSCFQLTRQYICQYFTCVTGCQCLSVCLILLYSVSSTINSGWVLVNVIIFLQSLCKVLKFKNFPPGNLFFVSTAGKFQILEYRKVAILPQGPVTMLIWPPTWNTKDCRT